MNGPSNSPERPGRQATARRVLMLAGRLLMGSVFVYAAYSKLRQPWLLFAASIDSYRLLPEQAVLVVARTLPWFELALGVLLLAGYRLRWVASGASALLLVFFAVMLRSHSEGMAINCGCFGVGEALSVKTLVRDGLLLAVSVSLAIAAFFSAES